ncbi:MAG: helix-turn-helix domain-containing protein [Bacteroidota bacterium]
MPWSQLSPMDQKTQFIADYLRRELCEHYGISRKTGYKWIERYEHGVSPAWPSAPDARMCARPRRPRR